MSFFSTFSAGLMILQRQFTPCELTCEYSRFSSCPYRICKDRLLLVDVTAPKLDNPARYPNVYIEVKEDMYNNQTTETNKVKNEKSLTNR